MIKIFINTFKVLMRKKEFILISALIPAVVTVFLSFMMGQSSSYNIGILDNDKSFLSESLVERLEGIKGVNIVNVDENIEMALLLREVILVIEINEGFSENIFSLNRKEDINIQYVNNSEILEVIRVIIKEEISGYSKISKSAESNRENYKEILDQVKVQSDSNFKKQNKESTIDATKSLGVIIIFIFFSASLITRYIILENKRGTKGRILASGISKWKYNLSILLVFYFASSFTSIVYYAVCRVLNFDFKMENSIYYLVILLFINLLAISFNLFIGSLVKKPENATNLNIIIVVPLAMLSGCFWEFNFMGDGLQRIGNMIPLRWAIIGVEKLKMGETIESLSHIFLLLIMVSVILFVGSRISAND